MKTFCTFLRYLACYYFEGNKILKCLINMCQKKKKSNFASYMYFFYLPIFLSISMETVCAFPRYFTLTVFLFSWLLVDNYEYLPSDFKDCFAITATWNTVMTKTGNMAFAKAILILTNK